jgi:tetratricopeptide (TPR) repeat protein
MVASSVVAQESEPASEENDAEQWINLGYKYVQMGRPQESLNAFERALIMKPHSKRARFGVGTAYIQMKEYRSALNILVPLSQEHPEDSSLKNNIAWLYATAEDHSVRNGAKAVATAQEALLLAPRDYHVWSTLAEAYYVSSEYEKAVRAVEEAIYLAADMKALQADVSEYREQRQKCRKAAQAMSLIE